MRWQLICKLTTHDSVKTNTCNVTRTIYLSYKGQQWIIYYYLYQEQFAKSRCSKLFSTKIQYVTCIIEQIEMLHRYLWTRNNLNLPEELSFVSKSDLQPWYKQNKWHRNMNVEQLKYTKMLVHLTKRQYSKKKEKQMIISLAKEKGQFVFLPLL